MTTPDRTRARTRVGAALVACAVLGAAWPATADPTLGPPGRKAPAGCAAVEVQRGDTTWAIARANTLTLDQIAALNPQISNLAQIRPGDQLAVSCGRDPVALAIPQSVTRPAVDVTAWLGERERDGRLTWRAAVAHLYAQGLRGDDLLILAAVAECESNRWSTAVGDTHLVNATWGPSIGVWQVRSVRAAAGTGAPRDEVALRADVAHQAWAAIEVFRAQGFRAWTCHQNGHHVGQLGFVRVAAAEIGVI